jgi:hypothetical protein
MITGSARRPLLLASWALIAVAIYDLGWMTKTMAASLPGWQKLVAPVLAGAIATYPALLALVIAVVVGSRSRVLGAVGVAVAVWVASAAASPWAWRLLGDDGSSLRTGTTVSTVVISLATAGAIGALSAVILRADRDLVGEGRVEVSG